MPEIIVKLGEKVLNRFFFDKEILSIGRARDNDIVIENLAVSRNHARIRRQDGSFVLTDLNSANGTYVNGSRINKSEVKDGDLVTVGKHTLVFVMDADPPETPDGPPPPIDDDHDGPPTSKPQSRVREGAIGLLSVTKGKQTGAQFALSKTEQSIGRANDNDIRLHDWFVSKRHAVILKKGDTYTLKDLQSWRGTTVNGNSITEIELSDGDEIVVGTTVISFKANVMPNEIPKSPSKAEEFPEDLGKMPEDFTDSSSGMMKEVPAELAKAAKERESRQDIKLEDEEKVVAESRDTIEQPEEALASAPESRATKEENVVLVEGLEDDDEFAPMTDEEMLALEEEADREFAASDNRVNREEAFELADEFVMGLERDDDFARSDDRLRLEEEAAVGEFDPDEADLKLEDEGDEGTDDGSLFEDSPSKNESAGSEKSEAEAVLESFDDNSALNLGSFSADQAVDIWKRALENKSPLIREYAEKELKKLTGSGNDGK